MKSLSPVLFFGCLFNSLQAACQKDTADFQKLNTWLSQNRYGQTGNDILRWFNSWKDNFEEMRGMASRILDIKLIDLNTNAGPDELREKVEVFEKLAAITEEKITVRCFRSKTLGIMLKPSDFDIEDESKVKLYALTGLQRLLIYLDIARQLVTVDKAGGFFPPNHMASFFVQGGPTVPVIMANLLDVIKKTRRSAQSLYEVSAKKADAHYKNMLKKQFLEIISIIESAVATADDYNSEKKQLPKKAYATFCNFIESEETLEETTNYLTAVAEEEARVTVKHDINSRRMSRPGSLERAAQTQNRSSSQKQNKLIVHTK